MPLIAAVHDIFRINIVYHVLHVLIKVRVNFCFPRWPLTHTYPHTHAPSWLRTMVTVSWVQYYRKRGACTADLLTARAEEKATFMSRSGGQHHHTSTHRRADWKLIKNVSVQWMTGSFCWSSALTEEVGRSCVPSAGEPLVASAIVSLPSSCLISGSISMKLLSCLWKW